MAFTVEDLARTALVRILPRSRYRLAANSDSRFQSFASNTTRIAYRQQGGTPAFLLFAGPGQDPRAAATAAAVWAEAGWRPNAIQRSVRPGVVVVHVAPAGQLAAPGPVPGTAVPAAVWTVDSETGRVVVEGKPPGSPPGGELKRAAATLMKGVPAPSLGELDLAERTVMQVRSVGMPPRLFSGIVGIFLLFIAFRYGLGALFGLLTIPDVIASSGPLIGMATLVTNLLLVAGIALGVALVFNFRNLAFQLPGFSSPVTATRNLTWGGYAAVMIALAVLLNGPLLSAPRQPVQGAQGDYTHVTATIDDDGGQVYVATGGELTVDLSGWPQSEWAGVEFKTSNPSILALESGPQAGGPPHAIFSAHQQGTSRVDATSADGRYTFEVRVSVFNP